MKITANTTEQEILTASTPELREALLGGMGSYKLELLRDMARDEVAMQKRFAKGPSEQEIMDRWKKSARRR